MRQQMKTNKDFNKLKINPINSNSLVELSEEESQLVSGGGVVFVVCYKCKNRED